MANSKDVVVTGVSTGIGWGTTKVLVSKGFRVFGSVRKQAAGVGDSSESAPFPKSLKHEMVQLAIQCGRAVASSVRSGDFAKLGCTKLETD
jgi:NAD(P)-dependent dehydrogenase (short-subunit alcohol dehydrogenase family)